jgi:hypothetical protein
MSPFRTKKIIGTIPNAKPRMIAAKLLMELFKKIKKVNSKGLSLVKPLKTS